MIFENISFYDAAALFPKKINKGKDNVHLNFRDNDIRVFRGDDFPKTINNNNDEMQTGVGVRQRKQVYVNDNIKSKRTYAETSKKTDNKKRMLQSNKTGNEEYNQILCNPNGRIPQTNSKYNNNYNSNYTREENSQITQNKNEQTKTNQLPYSAVNNAELNTNVIYNYLINTNDEERNKIKELMITFFKIAEYTDRDNFF